MTATNQIPLIWIPYYAAPQTYDWYKYGFDAAIHQPDYYELSDTDATKLPQVAGEAKNYRLGIELALNYDALTNTTKANKYLSELSAFTINLLNRPEI